MEQPDLTRIVADHDQRLEAVEELLNLRVEMVPWMETSPDPEMAAEDRLDQMEAQREDEWAARERAAAALDRMQAPEMEPEMEMN